eukprot:CAMPEP_0201550240 /NCGR_PEP_ID=MMETSP0173_2-20130828/6628_1 /ASSEMBLY_ACC=CAM_ASM_000268 /TAXON_ID=218659 /ORGANISM="Vexillifera sp., Strain DIVA3 564/2" /LENGTH=152 /DNA_ID=CAMNT_0047960155 /DNA_START=281 /DNA_END=739 /DNA_ORIENTATION=+
MAASLTHKCYFSGYNVYPGFGKTYVRVDGKSFQFASGKTESFFFKKRNPRKISWTGAYRHVHKKGIAVQTTKRRARRRVKIQRAIVGASLETIKAKRAEKPDFRAAQRQAAQRELKEKRRAQRAARREAQKARSGGAKSKQKAARKSAGKGR